MDLFTTQFFIGFILGNICLGIYFIIFKPLAGEWANNRIKTLKDANNQLTTRLNSIIKGEEIVFEHWQKDVAELKFIKERLRVANKTNVELGDTIYALSKEKSALQDKCERLFIQCDMLKTKMIKLTSPAYEKSSKVITKEGKVKDGKNS